MLNLLALAGLYVVVNEGVKALTEMSKEIAQLKKEIARK